MTRKPIVALIYDFDGTLSPLNMQEFGFIEAIEIKDKKQFWDENNKMVKEHNASNILCYMKLMLDKAAAAHVSIKREQFVEFGKNIELYKIQNKKAISDVIFNVKNSDYNYYMAKAIVLIKEKQQKSSHDRIRMTEILYKNAQRSILDLSRAKYDYQNSRDWMSFM